MILKALKKRPYHQCKVEQYLIFVRFQLLWPERYKLAFSCFIMKQSNDVKLVSIFFFYRLKATTRAEDFHCHQRCLLVGTQLTKPLSVQFAQALIPDEWTGRLFSENIAVTHPSGLFSLVTWQDWFCIDWTDSTVAAMSAYMTWSIVVVKILMIK